MTPSRMNKEQLANEILTHYSQFIDYINKMSPEDFEFRLHKKWSAGQQLEHIVLCIEPLVKVCQLPKFLIVERFGKINRVNQSYPQLVTEYLKRLNDDGKASSQYLPKEINSDQKKFFIEKLKILVDKLISKLLEFEENELESFIIPHPILGKITMKEMFYNAIYHVKHHKMQISNNLKLKSSLKTSNA